MHLQKVHATAFHSRAVHKQVVVAEEERKRFERAEVHTVEAVAEVVEEGEHEDYTRPIADVVGQALVLESAHKAAVVEVDQDKGQEVDRRMKTAQLQEVGRPEAPC